MPKASVRELLDAGMHYGHHTSRWNPKMKPYIFGKRNLIHIINLRETLRGLLTACRFVTHVAASGKMVVFVGTKRQARRIVREKALACGMPFVAERWLGGTLTNFRTIRSRLDRLFELEDIVEGPGVRDLTKKEAARLRRELAKARRNLDGIRAMDHLPGAVIVVDPRREKNAIAEANRLNIPTISLADTDCDPDGVDVLIPGNDDAMRSIEVILQRLSEAVLAGKEKRKEMARIEAAANVAAASQASAGTSQPNAGSEHAEAPAAPAATSEPQAPATEQKSNKATPARATDTAKREPVADKGKAPGK